MIRETASKILPVDARVVLLGHVQEIPHVKIPTGTC